MVMNDQIKRMNEISNYNPTKGKIAENFAISEQQNSIEHELTIALDQVMKQLPQTLAHIAKNSGDRDGQIEMGQQNQQEAELNEAIGTLLAGGALALPAIGNIVGKVASFLGQKLDNQKIQNFGKITQDLSHKLHHKYEAVIDKVLSPLTRHMNPQQRHAANKILFYAIVAALGGVGAAGAVKAAGVGNVGLAAVETGLTGVKATEIIAAAKDVVPKILANFIK
jgi:hypothetical protein